MVADQRLLLRSGTCASMGAALLALVAGPLTVAPARAQQTGDPDTACYWREVSAGAAADGCLLNAQPFDNYGRLDRL